MNKQIYLILIMSLLMNANILAETVEKLKSSLQG